MSETGQENGFASEMVTGSRRGRLPAFLTFLSAVVRGGRGKPRFRQRGNVAVPLGVHRETAGFAPANGDLGRLLQ